MPKVWYVTKREYLTRVITKGFIISTVVVPALIVGLMVFQVLMVEKAPARPQLVAILDETGTVGPLVQSMLARPKLPDGKPAFIITEMRVRPRNPEVVRKELSRMTRQRELSGYLWIPRSVLSGDEPELVVANPGAFMTLSDTLDRAVNEALMVGRLRGRGVRLPDLAALSHTTNVRVIHLTDKGESEDRGQGFAVAIGMATILYGSLMFYGITTMRSVLEEKTTRVMEILISSARPFEFLAGKILGVAAVGLTQFLIWAACAGLLAAYGFGMSRGLNRAGPGFSVHLPPELLAFSIIYFAGGYFLFASLFAAIGSAVSNEQDAQQLQMPVTFLLVASFLLFNVVLRNPDSAAAIILSMIPFCSPILMVMRIALHTPPLWQIALSLVLLALTTLAVAYASARIYRVGVLMYGKRPSVAELFRWLRYS